MRFRSFLPGPPDKRIIGVKLRPCHVTGDRGFESISLHRRGRCEPDVVVADLAAWGLQIRVQAIWAKQHFALDKRTIRVSAIPRGAISREYRAHRRRGSR